MKNFLLTWIGTAIALIITANIVPGFFVTSFVAALVAAIVIGLVNAIVRPILGILAFPITLITFGLFSFVLNAIALMIASALTPAYGFRIDGFIAALLGSIVLSIVSSVINHFVRIVD
ncbi:phage holin family protein [Calothrix sp. UHCC 0171]|uniref:phage holin family protein n=1 Tax=Calothrix sp. UHCC 0171 TaxID=3110245 RepID=UPI002B2171AD|nr:phage holin family protein [Calothrix sp. UHCC 0171]MEA5570188.1 phage holin family protein [Calothrix sp. UHCC 0171]